MHKKSLVIGINKYLHFSALENCINDAEDIHNFLKENGFDSTLLKDSSHSDLIKAIKNFKSSISENTVSVIFYSGHGLQDDKFNYLVASDSEVRFVEDIKYNCVLADDLLIRNSKTNLHLLILDACRNNPFYSGLKNSSIGLLKMNAPAGTLIAFSTSPNSSSIERVGERNGVYTKYLLKNMQTPNLPAELVFKNTRSDVIKDTNEKQIPWEESSLFGEDFSFVKIKQERIEDFIIQLLSSNKQISLPELMPFFTSNIFDSVSIEKLILTLLLIKISFSNEQENLSSKTVDEDYFNEILIDKYYPKFQERIISEDKSSEIFDVELFDKITIEKNVNFGFNILELPEDSFPQLVMNFIKFNGKEGILCFYISVIENQHFLKPIIITLNENDIEIYNFKVINGNRVTEITNHYFKLREPFEKEVPNFQNYFDIIEIDEGEL
ncbi:caspase family protein [Flavobacterium sp. 7A]|uniref:caspase family protein n=1 Tax=Flavobacterium sp. 7A TaxID=2940571 RepID=UPI0022261E87|nr:caspase family protein [Flavobacterium sp. 7A]MCW2120387.1 hypothetical protein [Flavobacterium sp. 7A]